jgi:hypothetical protein
MAHAGVPIPTSTYPGQAGNNPSKRSEESRWPPLATDRVRLLTHVSNTRHCLTSRATYYHTATRATRDFGQLALRLDAASAAPGLLTTSNLHGSRRVHCSGVHTRLRRRYPTAGQEYPPPAGATPPVAYHPNGKGCRVAAPSACSAVSSASSSKLQPLTCALNQTWPSPGHRAAWHSSRPRRRCGRKVISLHGSRSLR